MNCLLLLPDGVGVRNFVLGKFLIRLQERGIHTHALHVIPESILPRVGPEVNGSVSWGRLQPYRNTPVAMVLQYSLAYAQMYWADTQAMRYIRDWPIRGTWRRRAVMHTAKMIGRATAAPAGIRWLDQWHCRTVNRQSLVADYREIFEEVRPSVLFCSHQRSPDVLPAVLAARQLGIPTATFIFSWDNLSSKGRIAAPFEHYLVWSKHMAGEMLRFYPDIDPKHVHIVGTPQFDPYADTSLLWPREEFFARIGADPGRPLICYSGGDTSTCPDDPAHVAVLMRLIRDGRIGGDPQVIVRPAPVDDGSRYAPVRDQFPELLFSQPDWVHADPGEWSRVIPMPDDVRVLANLTQHADININLGSTMTLDFAIHDKPVVNIAFDVSDPPPFGRPVWEFFYRFDHYRPVVELGAARFARSAEEMAEHVNTYLKDPSLDRAGRRALVDMQVGAPIGTSSDRTIDVLQSIAR